MTQMMNRIGPEGRQQVLVPVPRPETPDMEWVIVHGILCQRRKVAQTEADKA